VDEAAESVATTNVAVRRLLRSIVVFGRPEFEGSMWPLAVVGR
jgi:hypothetical protein